MAHMHEGPFNDAQIQRDAGSKSTDAIPAYDYYSFTNEMLSIKSHALKVLEQLEYVGHLPPAMAHYALQCRNHVRRVIFNCDEAIDYARFITGEKRVR